MRKLLLLVAPMLLVLAFYEPTEVTAQENCAPMNIPDRCQDTNQININNRGKTIGPPNICVDPGETISVRVTPPGTSAQVSGKGGGWPNGSGSSFTLVAPSSGTYDYNVYFEDGSCMDPRIRVRD